MAAAKRRLHRHPPAFVSTSPPAAVEAQRVAAFHSRRLYERTVVRAVRDGLTPAVASSSSIAMGIVGVVVFGVTCCLIFLPSETTTLNATETRVHGKPVRWEVVNLWEASSRHRQLAFSDTRPIGSQKASSGGHEGSGEEEWQLTEMAVEADAAPTLSFSFLSLIISSIIAIQCRY